MPTPPDATAMCWAFAELYNTFKPAAACLLTVINYVTIALSNAYHALTQLAAGGLAGCNCPAAAFFQLTRTGGEPASCQRLQRPLQWPSTSLATLACCLAMLSQLAATAESSAAQAGTAACKSNE
jgi:hypothetical protein